MTVSAILDRKGHQVVTVHPDIPLSEAIRVLTERGIGAVVVVTDDGIEGILSERDILHALGSRGAAALDAPVRQLMTRKVVTCRRADTVAGLMEIMTEQKFRHLPVVEQDRLVGLVSIGDVVKWRVGEYEAEQEALRDYIKTA
ncbi:MAG: CBS domain-containing protein [Xanthobacteraceae bacterium]